MKFKKILPYLILIVIVPIAGEFQFYPLELDFRVSFATPVLFLGLLYFRGIHAPLAATLAGVSVVITRVLLGLFDGEPCGQLFMSHSPVIAYYITYGLLFHFVPFYEYEENPIIIGYYATLLEIGSTMSELMARNIVTGLVLTPGTFLTIIITAFIRSTFVMGIILIFLYYNLKVKEEQQRRKNDETLMLISDLFVGMTHLKASIEDSEKNTAECFKLSKMLRKEGCVQLSRRLLNISGKIHENKKNAQRVYASLSNLINKQEFNEILPISEIVNIVIKMNQTYAMYLKKNITFRVTLACPHTKFHSYFLLSILNNLIANAIEAIEKKGTIKICAYERKSDRCLVFHVVDNGPGIDESYLDVIFSPGYTTKYNDEGNPSNGIGLSYIKQIIEEHNGKIELLKSVKNEVTEFKFELPVTLDIIKYCNEPKQVAVKGGVL